MTKDVARWRRVARIVVGVWLVLLISRAIYPIVWRLGWQPAIDALRWFNKKVQNPMTLKAAGKRKRGLAALHHTGRKSGREYVVPVLPQRTGQSFFIPLTYGTNVDWLRNVVASGGCTIDHDGMRHDTVAPAILPMTEAAPYLTNRQLRVFGLLGVESFVRLEISHSERPAEQAT